ncbi:integral membrane protein [Sporormia fimetaria CBS 119925]|uniref:Integral membrane protein n=1 Tax=Sporormia fimetaria CBS 119925 TaxID=1340428 RepID=A0A6A6VRI9_9PLEO|nr:integral membrane protein [Sporormia fimetaria CBS 119925]
MVLPRIASLLLRFLQFASAAIVLGLMAWFLDRHHHYGIGPKGREVYTIVIAAISIVGSLIWLIPTLANMLHYPFDLLMAAAWFAAFGILVDYVDDHGCGAWWSWKTRSFHDPWCSKWKAAESFAFISAISWFLSFVIGVYVFHRILDPVARRSHV